MILKNTLHTGLVDGVSARITPAGLGIEMIFAAGSMRGLTRSSFRFRSNNPSEHASFLMVLCSTTPNPVSFTAQSAYRADSACAALAVASVIRSTESRS